MESSRLKEKKRENDKMEGMLNCSLDTKEIVRTLFHQILENNNKFTSAHSWKMMNLHRWILYHDDETSDIQMLTSNKARIRQENKRKNRVYQC
jgi:DNA-directed RNA polymerase specialized sigma subunit